MKESINSGERNYRRLLDADAVGNTPSDGAKSAEPPPTRLHHTSNGESVHCAEAVAKGDYEWQINGMSWLVNVLHQNECVALESCAFIVGGEEFILQYNPKCGNVGSLGTQRGSLCLVHQDEGGITFRYRILIKNAAGTYVQWGPEGNVCCPAENTYGRAFGPDVYFIESSDETTPPGGVFGLTHEELTKSDFVLREVFTVKFELEVRPDVELDPMPLKKALIEVPPCSMGNELLAMFEEGRGADVTFIVQGKVIPAHSQILAARSTVCNCQLNSGMKESISKEVVVQNCDAETFKALLRFLYTDDLNQLEQLGPSSESESVIVNRLQAPFLQELLALSHLYQVARLRTWCEKKLSENLTVDDCLSVLCQAHLYDAKQLEQACLTFIKDNFAQMVSSYDFGRICKEWPEVMLKINTATVGLDERSAASAFEAVREIKGKEHMALEETVTKTNQEKARDEQNSTCKMESLKRCNAMAEEGKEIPAKKRKAP